MIIRKAKIEDALPIKELHDRSVMELGKDHYSTEQLLVWINKSPLKKYLWRMKTQRIFIAELNGKMLGYVRWYPETDELCSICVAPEFARQGIATKLMEFAYQDAIEHGVEKLWLDASLNAVPFYEVLGWEYVSLSTDGPLDSVRMIRYLLPMNFQQISINES